MERTGCAFGACPAYMVTIYGNGTVVYEGFDSVAVTGRQTHQVSQEDVEELVQEFYLAGFFDLDDRYIISATDLPSTTTSITIGDASKSVYRYGSSPEKLVMLENKIDQIAGTDFLG